MNPFEEVVTEFKHAPTGGKVLAVVALVAVCGVGLYSGFAAKNAGGGATPATALGIDPNSLSGTDGSATTPFNLNGSSDTSGDSSGGGSTSNPAQAVFVPKPNGVSGYENGSNFSYYNNGQLQGTGIIGDISNLAKTVMPSGWVPSKSGISGYESNGYAVAYNNGALQSVITLLNPGNPPPKPPTQKYKPAAKGVSGYESGSSLTFYNNGQAQGTGVIGDVANLSKTKKPSQFKAAAKGVSGYESNGYAVAYNNGSLQSVLKLTGHA